MSGHTSNQAYPEPPPILGDWGNLSAHKLGVGELSAHYPDGSPPDPEAYCSAAALDGTGGFDWHPYAHKPSEPDIPRL